MSDHSLKPQPEVIKVRASNKKFKKFLFFLKHTATTEIYTLSLHDALPISANAASSLSNTRAGPLKFCKLCPATLMRSEEHTSELQSLRHLVCRLLLEKKKVGSARDASSVDDPRPMWLD